jgi:hypothetical protein
MRHRLLALGVVLAAVLVAVFLLDPLGTNRPGTPEERPESERPNREDLLTPADRRTAELSGRVWRAGTPSASRVEVWTEDADDPTPRDRVATTDAGSNGAFRLRDLPVGSYRLTATAKDTATGSVVFEIRGPSGAS